MKKTAFLLLMAIAATLSVSAQKNKEVQWPDLPVDEETKLITYTEVVSVDGVAAGDLYDRFMKWFNGEFKNPAEKLRKTDKDAGEIEAFLRHRIYNKDKKGEQASDAGLTQFTLKVLFKDGRYKYTVTELNHKRQSYFALEEWMNKDDEMAEKHADYLAQVDTEIRRVIDAMKKGVADDGKKAEDDW